MKIHFVAFLILLQLGDRRCAKEESKKDLESLIGKVIVDETEKLFERRKNGHCDVPGPESEIPVKNPEHGSKADQSVIKILICDGKEIIRILSKSGDNQFDFEIKHFNLVSKIKFSGDIPTNVDDNTRNYIRRRLEMFMERFDNIALNTKEILTDIRNLATTGTSSRNI
jgi:hypothetical protein